MPESEAGLSIPDKSKELLEAHLKSLDGVELSRRATEDELHESEEISREYLLHFEETIEGGRLNPELAEYNLDSSLVTTWMLKNRRTFPVGKWPQEIEWFGDKYKDSELLRQGLNTPISVVTNWLRHLGPHNDLHGAEVDLKNARSWLIEDAETNGRQRNYSLLADIAIELSAIDSENQTVYLKEAAAYVQSERDALVESGDLGKAAIQQAKLSSIRTSIKRKELTGTNFPTKVLEDEQYNILESHTLNEISELGEYVKRAIKETSGPEALDFSITCSTQKAIDKATKKVLVNMGSSFEALTYMNLLAGSLLEQNLDTTIVRTGTLRQEAGLTHKGVELAGGVKIPESFNFNFDLEYVDGSSNARGGIITSAYIQNKLVLPQGYSKDSARKMSERFFNKKVFVYSDPSSLLGFEPNITSNDVSGFIAQMGPLLEGHALMLQEQIEDVYGKKRS